MWRTMGTGAAVLALTLPGQAIAADAGYVFDDSPTTAGTYTPPLALQYNSTGAANTISHVRTGAWDVVFRGIGAAGGGLDLTGVASGPVRCGVGGFSQEGADEHVFVTCEDGSGAPIDEAFTLA